MIPVGPFDGDRTGGWLVLDGSSYAEMSRSSSSAVKTGTAGEVVVPLDGRHVAAVPDHDETGIRQRCRQRAGDGAQRSVVGGAGDDEGPGS